MDWTNGGMRPPDRAVSWHDGEQPSADPANQPERAPDRAPRPLYPRDRGRATALGTVAPKRAAAREWPRQVVIRPRGPLTTARPPALTSRKPLLPYLLRSR
ncbi:hypothetical protein GCM10010284_08350 [Streptomyces rubiginosohelvolus]|uniref:Uncharacterized protein n=1 Tax=Streptomyces rubiginosohelvolus TaxID=67362 RepID=A0ABQ3C090_9ACTN|nr:hypothetical protein GCM10010284_08350 [Streptomyces rubiginosohelvolus]GGZ63514.1 hypothetical protein GCM10010328_42590 [Streptomyces pluricolorescens]